MIRRLLLAGLLAFGLCQTAKADQAFTRPGGEVVTPGIGMCLNASGYAVPCSSSASTVASASGTTGAVAASLPATAGVTNYICGFTVSALGGTASVGPISVSGLVGSKTFTYQLASSATGATLTVPYQPCIPASATNSAITVTTTADGTATAVNVGVWGYQQ